MPLYEYRCSACGTTFEIIQKFSDAAVETCEKCGGRVRKLLSSPAIQFKGAGWYITDYARKGSGASDSKSSEGRKDGGTADAGDASRQEASASKEKSSGEPAKEGTVAKEKSPAAAPIDS